MMFLSSSNAKHMVLLGYLLVSLACAKQQKRICDTSFTISSNYRVTQMENTDGNGDIHNRSLSAWTWIPNISSSRIPPVMFEAQCSSEICSPTGSDADHRLNSVPIHQNILVLKQDSQDRRCFKATFERVVVGCTCVWAQTS